MNQHAHIPPLSDLHLIDHIKSHCPEGNTGIDVGFACVADQLVLEGPKNIQKQWNSCKVEPTRAARLVWFCKIRQLNIINIITTKWSRNSSTAKRPQKGLSKANLFFQHSLCKSVHLWAFLPGSWPTGFGKIEPAQLEWCGATKSSDGTLSTSSWEIPGVSVHSSL